MSSFIVHTREKHIPVFRVFDDPQGVRQIEFKHSRSGKKEIMELEEFIMYLQGKDLFTSGCEYGPPQRMQNVF